MPPRLTLHAPGASRKAVEESVGYAESLLTQLSNPLELVFQARARIRSRGASRYPDFIGLTPELVADARVLEQAEAIAMLTCYGPRSAPKGSGLVLNDEG